MAPSYYIRFPKQLNAKARPQRPCVGRGDGGADPHLRGTLGQASAIRVHPTAAPRPSEQDCPPLFDDKPPTLMRGGTSVACFNSFRRYDVYAGDGRGFAICAKPVSGKFQTAPDPLWSQHKVNCTTELIGN
jgi:hypothetical protein